MTSCIYPGSFDPIHNGHIDVIENLAKIFDKVYVATLINKNKNGRFSTEDKLLFIEKAISNIDKVENIEVITFDGLLADFVKEKEIDTIVKGIRNTIDYEMEKEMALSIKLLDKDVQTLFLPASTKVSSISSTIVIDLIKNNGNLEEFVPIEIVDLIKEKYREIYE